MKGKKTMKSRLKYPSDSSGTESDSNAYVNPTRMSQEDMKSKKSNKDTKETTGHQGSSANSRPWPAPLDEETPRGRCSVFEQDSTEAESPPNKDNETKDDPLRKTRKSLMKQPRATLKRRLTRPTYISGSSGTESDVRGQTVRTSQKAMKKRSKGIE
ncbi:uncharacterized protein [Branchiostoma lanceolatum]|uniref:uncharacterized protein n=1 Tax=Branchiostoma lanceolatum TaxID=7740 RepID=UPI0034564C1B